jgi:hypothetical protein
LFSLEIMNSCLPEDSKLRGSMVYSLMPKVQIHSHSMVNANMLTVQAGTNCPQGGDSGHGGRTVLRLIDDGATALSVRINGRQEEDATDVELVFGGDTEAATFIEGLEFAVRVLRGQFGPDTASPKEEDIP